MFRSKRFIFLFIFLLLVFVVLAGAFYWKQKTTKVFPKEPKVALKLVASGLGNPTAISSSGVSDDTRVFVVDQIGKIWVVNKGKVISPLLLDISGKVQADGEMGLLGLAFHPKFAENSYFYVNYVDKEQFTNISRFTVSEGGFAEKNSEKVLLRIKQPYTNHNGGDLKFGPDGFLYIGLGDGGSFGDPEDRAQNLNTVLGKMLRIDVDRGNPYSIPSVNPFIKESGAKEEIWSLGLRNPWRFSFDKETGDLWIADVGQGEIEEIDLEIAGTKGGTNYGWRCYEGTREYNTEGCGEKSDYTFPVLEYDHNQGRCSVTGGYVYRGKKFPALVGKYFYGDYCGGQVYTATKNGNSWRQELVLTTDHRISTFGQGNDGELYLADLSTGEIFAIEDVNN